MNHLIATILLCEFAANGFALPMVNKQYPVIRIAAIIEQVFCAMLNCILYPLMSWKSLDSSMFNNER